jgi:hypothetical protein
LFEEVRDWGRQHPIPISPEPDAGSTPKPD